MLIPPILRGCLSLIEVLIMRYKVEMCRAENGVIGTLI
jgi:hypothetical protein